MSSIKKIHFSFVYSINSLKLKLKHAQTGAEAAALIRKHKFHLEHLPTKVQKNKEIWEALVEDMSIQQLCNYIGVLTSKGVIIVFLKH